MLQPARRTDVNQKQAEVWNGVGGRAWVEGRALLDHMYQPVVDAIFAACPPTIGDRVLDVGCGTGAVTIAYARHLDSGPACVGVDFSSPMIEAARARSEREKANAFFIRGDAQVYPFEEASFDLLVSRFGVMFFDDPVRAFANLRRAAQPNAKACFAVWRGPADNAFMREAELAAAPFLPDVPAPDPCAPGRFALSDRDRTEGILSDSGWSRTDILPADIPCSFPLRDLDYMFTSFGPIGGVFRQLNEASQAQLVEKVRPVFSKHVIGEKVHFTAGCWIILAHASESV
jgi:ubiquinone/menaquinone biosynthesis C-methylase UbiE